MFLGFGCTTPQPGTDVPLLRFEQSLAISATSFDTIYEAAHQWKEDGKQYTGKLNQIKADVKKALIAADNARQGYRAGTKNANDLSKALVLVSELLGQARLWTQSDDPNAPASNAGDAIAATIAEAEAHRSPTPKSWITTATLLIDLGGRVYKAVNKTRDTLRQDRNWSAEESLAFSQSLNAMFQKDHWQ